MDILEDNKGVTIRVGSIDYEVVREKGLAASGDRWGQIDYGRAKIFIEDSLEGSKVREVLAHEITHAILYEAGYEDHEEEMAVRIGKIIAVVLRDNDFTFLRDEPLKEVIEWKTC